MLPGRFHRSLGSGHSCRDQHQSSLIRRSICRIALPDLAHHPAQAIDHAVSLNHPFPFGP